VRDGVAKGYVVNYELRALPGLPEVREIEYPDDRRSYFKKGDRVLLLNYTNDPYRIVYDTIKVIDAETAIGVMHVGTFPDGIEFAAFTMSRNNYQFENMSVEDHQRLFADTRNTVPAAADLAGDWNGRLMIVPSTAGTLLNQVSPVAFQMSVAGATAQYHVGPAEFSQPLDPAVLQASFRAIDSNTVLGKCNAAGVPGLLPSGVQSLFGNPVLYFLLKRAQTAAPVAAP
jgi:hypothetical protein